MFNKFKVEYEDSPHWKNINADGKDIDTIHAEIA